MRVPTWRDLLLARALNPIACAVLVCGVPATLAACSADGRYVVIGTAKAQSASGTVEVDKLDAGATQVAVHLEHLAPPNRLGRTLTRYGVWFVPPTGTPVWGGELKFDREERTGDLTATSPFRHFALRVTAEPPERTSAPGPAIAEQEIALD